MAASEFEGQKSGRVEFEEGQDITQPIETEGPDKKAKLCNLNPGVICSKGKCTVRCKWHPWHTEFKQGIIHNQHGKYERFTPIKPGPPK